MKVIKFILIILCVFIWWGGSWQCSAYAKTKKIKVLTSYNFGPFITGKKKGFTYDFVRLMNKAGKNKYRFQLEVLPRVRINRFLKKKKLGVILFVNPKWMKDSKRKKYFWTREFLRDQNMVILHRGKKIRYSGVSSLHGFILGGVSGRRYKALTVSN
ncbi:MAG: polar amino acid transport system substrate-binding protein [bacterium]|jgi:polar amino acid transport system substrate-binding protein